MKLRTVISGRSLALTAVLLPLLVLFVYVMLRSGPLAPASVIVAKVERQAIEPALFGIGTVEARYTYRIGPTTAGRVHRIEVQVGDYVTAGRILGEMDPVDLDERIIAQQAAIKRAEAEVLAAEAQVSDAAARANFAVAQERRYEALLVVHTVSAELVEGKRQESQLAAAGVLAARANLDAARQELARARAERAALLRQRSDLRLTATVAGLVTARHVDPGTTVIAGQPVIEVIDPASLWINVRFDQLRASGLRAGLPAKVVLRSRRGEALSGHVLRVEPLADAVTEETLAKIVLDDLPAVLPPIGELAEITVALPVATETPVVSDASVLRLNGQLGVWVVEAARLAFNPVTLGVASLDGRIQILEGLNAGQKVIVYSQRALRPDTRIRVVDRLPGVS